MLYEIFHENRKIKFGLLSGCLTFMNRVGKNNKTKLSITPSIIFFKIMCCHEH